MDGLASTISELSPNLPFLLHVVLETPASINFFSRPSSTLAVESPYAHAVIRQYAVLLFSSVLVAAIFLFRPIDDTSKLVAGALSVYHLAPIVRAGEKIIYGEDTEDGKKIEKKDVVAKMTIQKDGKELVSVQKSASSQLGGAYVHFTGHGIVLAALVWLFLSPQEKSLQSVGSVMQV